METSFKWSQLNRKFVCFVRKELEKEPLSSCDSWESEIRKGEKRSRTQKENILVIRFLFTDEERLRIAVQQNIQNVPVRLVERLQSSRLQLQLLHRPIIIVSEQESSLFAAEHPQNVDILSVFRVFQFLSRDLLWEQQLLGVFEAWFYTGNRPLWNTLSNHKSLNLTTLKVFYWIKNWINKTT